MNLNVSFTPSEEQHSNIAIVCAGKLGRFALDDATCAGYVRRVTHDEIADAVG